MKPEEINKIRLYMNYVCIYCKESTKNFFVCDNKKIEICEGCFKKTHTYIYDNKKLQ